MGAKGWARRIAALAAMLAAAGAYAQIRTDASLGRSPQALAGPQYLIPESLGALRGANLFHSFSTFNIASGESATFTTTTLGIANVISRVTGGGASAINGLLRLAAADGKPNFFFINPAGVTFGAGAVVDVPGAFHVSTADYVKFGDGKFYADPAAGSTLSSAPPEAFGFLGAHRGAVAVTGGAQLFGSLLQPFSIAAGDITVDNARVATRGGDIRIVAIGDRAAEVPLTGALPDAAGTLRIVNGGAISAPSGSYDAGHVAVSAGDIYISQAGSDVATGIFSQANTGSTGNAGVIDVRASGDIRILDGGSISSSTFSSGNAGSVSVQGANITIDSSGNMNAKGTFNAAGIFSNANFGATGNAGTVDVRAANRLEISNAGEIATDALFDAGNAGNITIRAGEFTIDQGEAKVLTGVFSRASIGSKGHAGNIDVTVDRALTILGGEVSSSTEWTGDAGSVRIRAGDIYIDRAGGPFTTGIFSQAERGSHGRAGNVDVAATGLVYLGAGGLISSSTFGAGDAGEVRVSGGDIVIDANYSGSSTGIFSNAVAGTGNAGPVFVTTPGQLWVANGATISSSTFTSGNAGAVDVRAAEIHVDGGGFSDAVTSIASNAREGSSGRAGGVNIVASSLVEVKDGGEITSSAFSSGDAGSVTVTAPSVVVDGRGYPGTTGIASQANEGSGNAGNITVTAADSLTILGNGFISSGTFSAGHAGSVRVNAARILIDGTGATEDSATGIVSGAYRGSTGDAGSIDVNVSGAITILNAGEISSNTFASGNAGPVKVNAGSIVVDAQGGFAGIFSEAARGSSGHGGTVDVTVSGLLALRDEAKITSTTFGRGDAGTVRVTAGSLLIDGKLRESSYTGIASNTDVGATGNAGSVEVNVTGTATIMAAGQVSSSTFSSGDSGGVTVKAGSLVIDGAGSCPPCTGIYSQADRRATGRAGRVDVTVAGDLTMRDEGLITTGTNDAHAAGRISVQAQNITIDGGGHGEITGIVSNAISGTGDAGVVEVNAAGKLTLLDGGIIGSSTYEGGNAGRVQVTAGSMRMEGHRSAITSSAFEASSGNAGVIDVRVPGLLEILDGAVITSSTFSVGDAGAVSVRAGDIRIVRGVDGTFTTGIFSQANRGATGQGGSVDVHADASLTIQDGGVISSATFGNGDAGSVHVDADSIFIDSGGVSDVATGIVSSAVEGSGNAGTVDVSARLLRITNGGEVNSSTFSAGNAGTVRVTAGDIVVDGGTSFLSTGILSTAERSSSGNAGTVDINASGDITLLSGGSVTSASFSSGNAGSVKVRARNIRADGGVLAQATGILSETNSFDASNAGSIDVAATGSITLTGGALISSDSSSQGAAGSVRVSAANITIEALDYTRTGIFSRAGFDASAAGTIDVTAGTLRILNGGQISSSTDSYIGPAGSVNVRATDILVDGTNEFGNASSINARAGTYSGGQTGSVSVSASRSLVVSNGGELSITNDAAFADPAPVHPTLLTVSAPLIDLASGGSISAASTGTMPASNVHVTVSDHMLLDNASITTSAVDGNGGSITVDGRGAVILRNSQITTSVSGLVGNGGDITIATRGLVMDTGFIQANTAAESASGGRVNIDTAFLIPSGNSLFVGGDQPLEFHPGVFGYNVIQAAAPTGVSGTVNITTPALDISASLAPLSAQVLEVSALGRGLCDGGSSLAQAGRGGLPPSARGLLRDEETDEATARRVALAALLPVSARITCWR